MKFQSQLLGALLLISSSAFALTDADIVQIVTTANNVEIGESQLAESKTANKDVRAFAEDMIKVHQDNNKQGKDLSAKTKVTPIENDQSKALEKESADQKIFLGKLKGAEFDKAYVDREVAVHTKVLQTIDSTLLPSAQNPDLRALLIKTRPVVEMHLTHAKNLLARLQKPTGSK